METIAKLIFDFFFLGRQQTDTENAIFEPLYRCLPLSLILLACFSVNLDCLFIVY